MIERILPRRLDNAYRGHRLALWLFGLVVAMKSAQSVSMILRGGSIAKGADGIPVDTFAPAVAGTVVAVLAQGSVWRLTFCAIGVVALVRYRSAVPLLFSLFAANYLGSEVVYRFVPLVRVGSPPGPAVNLALFACMVLGLALSVLRRGAHDADESRAAE